MFALDCLIFDIILPANARPSAAQVTEGLGGEEVAQKRLILDVDLDLPQLEAEISPSFLLRRRGERRILVVDEAGGPLRQDPRTQAVVARDLRAEKDRLANLIAKSGARIGRMGAFGTWGEAAVVARTGRDLRAVLLLGWALDPTLDLDGRQRAQQLSQREFEAKLAAFEKRLDELDDATVLARVPPATLEKRGSVLAGTEELLVVHALSDRDGSWDIRKSYELEKRVAATDLFARIVGARQPVVPPAPPEPPAPPPAAVAETPKPLGPPLRAIDSGGRIVLVIPAERFDSDTITALGRRPLDVITAKDPIAGGQRERIDQHGCGFVAPLAFLSEVFLEGKPLDRRRFETEAAVVGPARALEAHLPRYGAVRVIDLGGKRWVTSELNGDPAAVVALAG